MLLFAIAVIWFFYHAQNKIIESKLREKDIEIKYQMELLNHTVNVQEDERHRIASELHDDVTSQLNIVNLYTSLLKDKVPDTDETKDLLEKVETSIRNSIERTRAMSHQLMPLMLKKFGFNLALHELTDNINLTGKLKIEVKDDHLVEIKDDYKVLHLYRIIQELLNNTLKYAEAKLVNITFVENNHQLTLTYQDDGVGLPKEVAEGLGLKYMQTRAKLLDGKLEILDNNPGAHFRLTTPNV